MKTNDKIKRMNITEFRYLGLLQEVNRLFFHPRGLALEVTVEGQTERIGGIWDYRSDLEGMEFGPNMISPAAADRVQNMRTRRLPAHQHLFGTPDGIQPLPDCEPEKED